MKKLLAIIPLSLAVVTAHAGNTQGYNEDETVTLTGKLTFRTAYDEEGEKVSYPALAVQNPIKVKYSLNKEYIDSGRYIQLMVDTMKKFKYLEKNKGKTITVTCDLGIADSGEEFTPVNCVMFGKKSPY